MNETAIALIATSTAVASITVPYWLTGEPFFDLLATMALGVLGAWSREIYNHYDENSPIQTNPLRLAAMIIPGIFGGIVAGDIAELAGYSQASWLFAASMGYLGAPAMEKITQGVLAIMDKALAALGVQAQQAQVSQLKKEKQAQEQDIAVQAVKNEKELESLKSSAFSDEEFNQLPVPVPSTVPTNGTYYSQRDPNYQDRTLPKSSDKVRGYGCFLVSLANLYQKHPLDLLVDSNFIDDGYLIPAKVASMCGGEYLGSSKTAPTSPCIAETDFYKDKSIPSHFYLRFPDNTIVDPLLFPATRTPNRYDGREVSYRTFTNIKV